MRTLIWIVFAVVAVIGGVFAYSYARNPGLPAKHHAEAVGFVLANPISSSEWQGLACPHRRAVIDLVVMSVAPQLCGTASDGGAMVRARKFQSQGPRELLGLVPDATGARHRSLSGFFQQGETAHGSCRSLLQAC